MFGAEIERLLFLLEVWIELLKIASCLAPVTTILMTVITSQPSLCQQQTGTAPTSAARALTQAKSLEKSGDYSKAIAALTSSTKAFPTANALYLELGNCLIHERRLNDALLNANTALSKCPPTAAMYRQRASANYMLHDYGNTLKDLDQACKMSAPTAEDYFTKANCLSNAGNSKAVIEILSAGLKLDPKNAEAYYLRAKTYKNLNQNALSESDFAKAMSLEK
jgi:tetratricopeptide (TPR) repeat protein